VLRRSVESAAHRRRSRKAQAEAVSHQIAMREGANWDTIGAIAEILGAPGVAITAMGQ